MAPQRAEQNLLFGLLALQNGLVSREDLIAAVSVWLVDKSRALSEILLERQALDRDAFDLIAALVKNHMTRHGGSAEQSLAALSSLDSAKEDLRKLGDAEVDATLTLASQRDPAAKSLRFSSSVGERTFGGLRFRVLRPHAKGGLGEVFVAHDTELHREVALKEIQADYADDPESRSRFVLEAEITGGLEHPGIVPVYGLGQFADGRPFYAMRFIKGDSLKEAVDHFYRSRLASKPATEEMRMSGSAPRPGRLWSESEQLLELRKLLGRFIDVCEAIEYAHSRGVLHRGLKPGNIMLGKYGETLVVDWGLAKVKGRSEQESDADEHTLRPSSASGSSATLAGSAVGTPAFMSPEQAAGKLDELGPPADVYSLGATLYYVLTGKTPFDKDDVTNTLKKVQAGQFLRPREVNPKVPRPLEAICLKAMSTAPEKRYPSPAALAEDVERWLADEPVLAWKEPWHLSVQRYLRRRRTLVAVLAALVVVLPMAFGIGAWFVAEERAQRQVDRREAEIKAQTADQISTYLIKTFESADPLGLDSVGFHGPGERSYEQTTRRVLDGGAGLLQDHLHDRPALRAGLLDAIGNSYRNLGEWNRAQALLQEGYELRRQELGEQAPETLASLHSLARLAENRGEYAEAERRYREVIGAREQLDPPQPLLVAQTKFYFAWMLFNQPLNLERPQFNPQVVQEAEQILTEVLKVREELLPANHRDIGHTFAALASVKGCQAGKDVEALAHAARAGEIFRQSDQESFLGSVVVEYLAAENHRKAGRFAEADVIYLKVLDLAHKHLGPRHPLVLMHMANMCSMYRKQGDMTKLHPMARELRQELKAIPALRSLPVYIDAMTQYGDILRGSSAAEAIDMYEETLRFARERPQENERHIQVLEQRLMETKAGLEK